MTSNLSGKYSSLDTNLHLSVISFLYQLFQQLWLKNEQNQTTGSHIVIEVTGIPSIHVYEGAIMSW